MRQTRKRDREEAESKLKPPKFKGGSGRQGSPYWTRKCSSCGNLFTSSSMGRKRCFLCSPAKPRMREGALVEPRTMREAAINRTGIAPDEMARVFHLIPESTYRCATIADVQELQVQIARKVEIGVITPLQGDMLVKISMKMLEVIKVRGRLGGGASKGAEAEQAAEEESSAADADEIELQELAELHGVGKEKTDAKPDGADGAGDEGGAGESAR